MLAAYTAVHWFHLQTQDQIFDILIIGGGINGCGIARDAVGRGYSVCLVEMNDLASGTSSSSTKLIHGGLRYLEQYEFDIQCAATAKEGLEINQSWLPHLVLTEVKLRDMSGVGLIERLATSKNAPLIYVMTGQGNLQRDENGVLSHIDARIVQAGASGFLSKPMPLSEIRIQLETAKLKALPARQRNITLSQ